MRYLLNYRMFENVDENKYSVIVTETSKNRYVAELKYEDDPKFGKIAKGGCRISVENDMYGDSKFKGKKVAYLWAFEVQEKNSGLGSIFLRGIIEKLKEIKINVITLDVFDTNVAAIKLYQKFGFKKVHELDCGSHYKMYLEI